MAERRRCGGPCAVSDRTPGELGQSSRFQALLFAVDEREDELPIGQLASIELRATPDGVAAFVVGGNLGTFQGRGESVDEALLDLWNDLESSGTRLSINRFRRNAFMTGLARQMGGGLACYLVEWGRPVGPEYIAPALASTDPRAVVSPSEHAAYINAWTEYLNRSRLRRALEEMGAPAAIFVLACIAVGSVALGAERWLTAAFEVLLGLVAEIPLLQRVRRKRSRRSTMGSGL